MSYIYIYIYIYMEHPFLMFLDHTQRRSTVGRTPLDERSARRRDLYLTTHDTHNRQISMPPVGFEPTISAGERPVAARLLRSWVRIPPGAWIFVCCECRVLSGRGLCDELITRPEEPYRLCCVVVCDLETSRICAPYIYDISNLRVNKSLPYTYTTINSKEVAQELNNIQINNQHKMTTVDKRDLYVNLPIQQIINITNIVVK